MSGLKGTIGARDFTGSFSGSGAKAGKKPAMIKKDDQDKTMHLRHIMKFLDKHAYEPCKVTLRADFDGKPKKVIEGLFASFDPLRGVIITDRKNNKHHFLPNRGVIEQIEFIREV